jgi:hypothetical protein
MSPQRERRERFLQLKCEDPLPPIRFKYILPLIMHLLGIDRAVSYTVLARSWTIFSGTLTLLFIARFLSPSEQGYYYTFSSLVSIQVVFELGFSFVILQLAAHETSQLQIDTKGNIAGDPTAHSRLASIVQKSVRWYSVAALLMGTALMIWGFRFFTSHSKASDGIAWHIPWICVVLAVVFTFQMDPIFSFLEGCGFVAQVARMRLAQAMTGSILAWLALSQHHGLFAPGLIIAGQAIAGFTFLYTKREFLLPLLRRECGTNRVAWKSEIWPFQWRIAVSFFCGYFIFPLFNPVLFAFRGATEAGKMGMSLTIALQLGAVAYAWINTKASPFGNMIARRDYTTLDSIFFRTLIQSSALLLIGEASALAALFFLGRYYPNLASRMLPIPTLALLMLAIFFNHILYSEALYLRAHKREPFLVLAVLTAVITSAGTLLAGKYWGAIGVTVNYFITGGVLQLIGGSCLFVRLRRRWHLHADDSTPSKRECDEASVQHATVAENGMS